MSLRRPMKAPTEPITDEDLKSLPYPVLGSPKLDGFRCIVNKAGLTSSMKPFTNRFVAEELKNPEYDGLDGEIIVGSPFKVDENDDVFHRTSGPIRRFDGKPDFTFFVFDYWKLGDLSYHDRWLSPQLASVNRIIVLEQRVLKNVDDVIAYEQEKVDMGYEGAMIRSFDGRYKEGRCTLKEQNIFKRKPFEECEGTIVGVEEQMENTNVSIVDSRGLSKRSSHQAGMVPKNTLGKFIIQSDKFKKEFKAAPGKGFDAKKRQEIWNNREAFIGQVVTVKYQKYGSIERPRMPNVIKIRPTWDLS